MNHIIELRKKFNYSQAKLAEILGVHQTAVSQWETGKSLPDIQTAYKLALVFGVTIEDLLDDAGFIPTNPIAIIRNNCGKLNQDGQNKVLAYTQDLLATGKYNKPQILPYDTEGINNGNS